MHRQIPAAGGRDRAGPAGPERPAQPSPAPWRLSTAQCPPHGEPIALKPRQVIAAQFGETRSPEPLDELLVVFIQLEPGLVAAIDQVADADPSDVSLQYAGVPDLDQLLGLQVVSRKSRNASRASSRRALSFICSRCLRLSASVSSACHVPRNARNWLRSGQGPQSCPRPGH